MAEVKIPTWTLRDGGGIAKSGTRITLTRLLFEPLKSKESTITGDVAEHFEFVNASDFAILFNGNVLKSTRTFAYSYPVDSNLTHNQLLTWSIPAGDEHITFKYRIRFTGPEEALSATRRGIRVYASGRLASAPSLLKADTNMHGFNMTHYLDGVVEADFIDRQPTDYIATDRQSLRWETPLLEPLQDFLTSEIKAACKAYQKHREDEMPDKVKNDAFTRGIIDAQDLTKTDRTLAYRLAQLLANACKKELADPMYRERLEPLVKSLGHGTLLTAITKLANDQHPSLNAIAVEIARLSKGEYEQTISYAKARVKSIEALRKIVTDQDFKKKDNEKQIQKMFETSPWLIDPTFSYMLSGDTNLSSMSDRLARDLKIGSYAKIDDAKRPDLVFLLTNQALGRVVIVELKSANTYLVNDHLSQLQYYMERAREWLDQHNQSGTQVRGQLIGSFAPPDSKSEDVVVLRHNIKNAGPTNAWVVRDYLEVLQETDRAHQELLSIYEKSQSIQPSGGTASQSNEPAEIKIVP